MKAEITKENVAEGGNKRRCWCRLSKENADDILSGVKDFWCVKLLLLKGFAGQGTRWGKGSAMKRIPP